MPRTIITLLVLMSLALAGCANMSTASTEVESADPVVAIAPPDQVPMMRAIWIHTWDNGMLSPEQVENFVAEIRAANINAVFAEVRKVGDAYYLNGIEPRASNIQGPADWDPLQQLIDLCHDTSNGQQYIEVHAWMVTFRVWRGPLENVPEGHLLAEHPDTIMRTASGASVAENTTFADPGHPMTEEWTVSVYRNVAAMYDVDGVHFDYVRYPEFEGDWGHNPVSLDRYRRRTGFEGTPRPNDPAWQEWRREQVRSVVRRIYGEVMEANPNCLVSASTLNWGLEIDPWTWQTSAPRSGAYQDWVSFMSEGIMDLNVLMNYSRHQTQPERYPDYTDLAIRTRADRHAIIGPGVFLNTVDDSLEQIRMAMDRGADGVNLYCFQETNNEGVPRSEFFRRLTEELWTEPVPNPERPWRDSPLYGAVIGQVFDEDGQWVDGTTVVLDGIKAMPTDGTGFFGFFRVDPGVHAVEVRTPECETQRSTVTVEAGHAARADFGEAAPGLSVGDRR